MADMTFTDEEVQAVKARLTPTDWPVSEATVRAIMEATANLIEKIIEDNANA